MLKAPRSNETIEIPAILKVKLSRVGDLLCTAFEGGSNYWYRIEDFVEPSELRSHGQLGDGPEGEIFRHIDYPLSLGGALMVSDFNGCDGEDPRTERLDRASIVKGLEVFRLKYPHHYTNWIEENDDAETGDVFLQCCLFGELVYG